MIRFIALVMTLFALWSTIPHDDGPVKRIPQPPPESSRPPI